MAVDIQESHEADLAILDCCPFVVPQVLDESPSERVSASVGPVEQPHRPATGSIEASLPARLFRNARRTNKYDDASLFRGALEPLVRLIVFRGPLP